MNIMNFFKAKCMVSDDAAHNLTGFMQHLSPIATLQQANAEKLEKAKEMLGTSWILHKANSIKRKEGI